LEFARVGDELAVDDVGEAPLEAAQGFFAGLALSPFALVVGPPGGLAVADLGDGHHVDGVVDPPVPGSGEPVADLLAGGCVDGGGAVVAGEVVVRLEFEALRDWSTKAEGDPNSMRVPCVDRRPSAMSNG
jgi:hypothetical protein